MAGEDRRHSSIVLSTNPFIEVTDTTLSINATQPVMIERTPSPTDELLSWKNSPKTKNRTTETQYAETEVEELLSMLRETESLEEQGDILQYIVSCYFSILSFKERQAFLFLYILNNKYLINYNKHFINL